MLKVEPRGPKAAIIPPAAAFYPLQGRKYTIAKSPSTGEMMLSIGNSSSQCEIDHSFEEVMKAEWVTKLGEYLLDCRVYIQAEEKNKQLAQVQFLIYQKELESFLSLLVKEDRDLYTYNPLLLDAPIRIQFHSNIEDLCQTYQMGSPRQFLKLDAVY